MVTAVPGSLIKKWVNCWQRFLNNQSFVRLEIFTESQEVYKECIELEYTYYFDFSQSYESRKANNKKLKKKCFRTRVIHTPKGIEIILF